MRQIGKFYIRDIWIVDENSLEVSEGCFVHNSEEPFKDGDTVIWDFDEDAFGTEEDVINMFSTVWAETDFYIDFDDPSVAYINDMSELTWNKLAEDNAEQIMEGLDPEQIANLAVIDIYEMIYEDVFVEENFARWLRTPDQIPFCETVLKIIRKECGLDD